MRNRTAILAALALAISGISIGCQNDNNGDSQGARVDRIGLDPRDTSDLDSTQNVAGARTGVGQGGVPREDSTGLINTEVTGEPLTTDVEPTPAAGTMTRDEADARQRNIDATRLDQDVAGGGVPPGTSAGNRTGTTTGREPVDRAQQRDTTVDRNDTRVIDVDDDDNDNDADATEAGVRIDRRPVPGATDNRTNNDNNTRPRQPTQQPTGADRTEQNRTGTGGTTRPSN